jgi:hypothetical protein
LPPRVDLAAIARLTWRSLRAGTIALGAALVLSSDDPRPRIGVLLAVALAGLATLAAKRSNGAIVATMLLTALAVGAVRRDAGFAGAAAVLALVLVAVWAHLRFREVALGLGLFGIVVVSLAGASLGFVLGFWLLGWTAVLLRELVRSALDRLAPKTETPALRALGPET